MHSNSEKSTNAMKSYRKELTFETYCVGYLAQVEACLNESGIKEGLLLCNAMHITASVFINDDESGRMPTLNGWSPPQPHNQ